MKRKLQVALIVSSITGLAIWLANAQGYNAFLNPTYQASGGPQITSLQENSVIGFHKLSWVVTGTVSTCQVTVDTSPDNSAWSTGGAITVQTCTSTGNSGSATSATANFIRINASTLSGTGSITFTYTGYVQNPSGGGLPAGLTFVSPTFTISSAGNGNAVLALSGNTSGVATLTAPAIAGTATNPVTVSNILQLPRGAGTTPSIGWGDVNTGLFSSGANIFDVIANGSRFQFAANNFFTSQPICDFAVGNNCLTFASNSISITGAGTANGQIERGFNVNVTPVTVSTSTTADQNLMAVTLPANSMNVVGRTFRVWVAGVYSTAATSTAVMTIEIKICSVSGCASGNVADVLDISSAALGTLTITNNAFNTVAYITTQTAGASCAWEAHGTFGIDEGALATAADSFFNDTTTATITGSPSAIDCTAQNFLQVSFAFSAASASNSATERQLVVEVVN